MSTFLSVRSNSSTTTVPPVMSSSLFRQRRKVDLAGAGRPDHADHLAALDVDVDALEHLVVAEGLLQALDRDLALASVVSRDSLTC